VTDDGGAWVGGIPDLELLTCCRCVRRVNPTSDAAEGWVMVLRSVDRGDRSDDTVWCCAACATPQEVAAFAPSLEQLGRILNPPEAPDPYDAA
jgi:hypothetical protein